MRLLFALLGLLTSLVSQPAPGAPSANERVLWSDDFSRGRLYERRPAYAFPGGGAIAARNVPSLLIPPANPITKGVITADLTITRRAAGPWTYAGIVLHAGEGNSWQLLLAEGPDGRRYLEMLEELDSVRHAQAQSGTPTGLKGTTEGALSSWNYGQRYRLTLRLAPYGIEGVIKELSTAQEWRTRYEFGSARVVRRGRPGIIAMGVDGHVQRLQVTGLAGSDGQTLSVQSGRMGTVVILSSNDREVDQRLVRAFRQAGFGVTLISREALVTRRLPEGKVDLFVLADARELPLPARDEVMRLLTSRGRVMAIGAPAAAKTVTHTSEGWLDRDGWTQWYARRLEKVPVRITPSSWWRTAYRPSQPGTITQDPTGGPDCWKVTVDLLNWDGWNLPVAGVFGPTRNALVFQAKGDAATTHLAVECVEEDESRWIATILLTPQWRWYTLTPSDFTFWPDHPAKHRGQPGDRFQPSRAVRLSFGLSGSHTPRVQPGRRTYWLRHISTARQSADSVPDFDLPDVEALWPSYKLYPMDHVSLLRPASEQGIVRSGKSIAWRQAACSPVWRERGRGFGRGRAWRWIPVLEAYDNTGRKRGALLSLTIGDNSYPGGMWANVAVNQPRHALRQEILDAIVSLAQSMVQGPFLLEGGSEFFSYKPGELVRLGIKVLNPARTPTDVKARIRVGSTSGSAVFEQVRHLRIGAGETTSTAWTWTPQVFEKAGYTVTATLERGGVVVDRIVHRIEPLRTEPPREDEFVRVKGDGFTLAGKPWYFQGINYWPTWMAGYPGLGQRHRECYDPEIIERDLKWLRSAGVNVISAVAAIHPPNPDDPGGYRDQLDFIERCYRHGIRVYFTLPYGRPYAGADFAKIKDYIERAGLHNHPAIMAWELAWEPIEGAWGKDLEKFGPDWNKWIEEQYWTVKRAVEDWEYDPRPDPTSPVPVPTFEQCTQSGPWNRYVAAFSRAFSDLISRAYGKIVRPLRAWDPNHLISFRGGACGIPSGGAFAHIHSVGVARHLDFLCPEGYNLQVYGWARPTPPDEIRKGGLITEYYRAVSRGKPIVWMEFGFTVNGYGEAWRPDRFRVRPIALQHQKREVEHFYQMILESGSRGAAPWWLPGGFRYDEKSDFGFVEPDGSERPVCEVFRQYQPLFARVRPRQPDEWITMDVDLERHRAWNLYSSEYLRLVKEGRTVGVRFSDVDLYTATTKPERSLTGGPLDKWHLPPWGLNAEFDALELKVGEAPWRAVEDGEVVEVPRGAEVQLRATVANIGVLTWSRGSGPDLEVMGSAGFGSGVVDVPHDVPPLTTVQLGPVSLPALVAAEGPLRVQMRFQAHWFGEARSCVIRLK